MELSDAQLAEYQELTFLRKSEVFKIHKLFRSLCPEGKDTLTTEQICELPPLKVNPFRDRICSVFCNDGGVFSFEDFLEMASVFSCQAPVHIKIKYAFWIFDFNGNNYIDEEDLQSIIQRLTAGKDGLPLEDIIGITDHILEEADLDADNMLCFAEFEHAISKCPDFLNSFRFELH